MTKELTILQKAKIIENIFITINNKDLTALNLFDSYTEWLNCNISDLELSNIYDDLEELFKEFKKGGEIYD